MRPALPPRHRPAMPRPSRPRPRYPVPADAAAAARAKLPRTAAAHRRLATLPAALAAVSLALFAACVFVASTLEPVPAAPPRAHTPPPPPSPAVAVHVAAQATDPLHGRQTVRLAPEDPRKDVAEGNKVNEINKVNEGNEVNELKDERREAASLKLAAEQRVERVEKEVPPEDRVSWARSWPASELADDSNLMQVQRRLAFTNRTMLNYFHMHKTGGVSTKVELLFLLNRDENRDKLTKRGQPMQPVETCYQLEAPKGKDESVEKLWRCDFHKILNMTDKERDAIDVMMGHQYWENGCNAIFGAKRVVKHFSIFRHPLPRKLSFFYHFFVRNLGREETAAHKDEVIAFLLGEGLPPDSRTRDSGPNYYASRLLSDGHKGFGDDHRYHIPVDKQDEAIRLAVDRVDRQFVFVGLQLQGEASQCMLQRAMQVLAHEHGIDYLLGTPKLAETTRRLNAGGYPWTAKKIWGAMDEGQRKRYKEVERVDLAIYDRVVRKFKEDVKMFLCEDKVVQGEFEEDVFE